MDRHNRPDNLPRCRDIMVRRRNDYDAAIAALAGSACGLAKTLATHAIWLTNSGDC
jgi:hypothetical protein